MTGKKNIVIKVNYPSSEKVGRNLAPKMITEWNIKRIALAAGALGVVLASLIYVFNKDSNKVGLDNVIATEGQISPVQEIKVPEIQKPVLSGQVIAQNNQPAKLKKESVKVTRQADSGELPKKTLNEKNTKQHESLHIVSRSILTYGINNKEPIGEITAPLKVSGKKPVWIYYFTELKVMKGSKVYHEWLKNGVSVSRQAIVISGDKWRTSSRKLLSEKDKGKWTVKMVDEKNRLLNEKTFKVE